jgi:hypothetical protein
LPATDAASGPEATPMSDSWRLVLLVVAGLLAMVMVLTPARTRA